MQDLTKLTLPELRAYKVQVLDVLKEQQRIAHKIDKEVKTRLKNGEKDEV